MVKWFNYLRPGFMEKDPAAWKAANDYMGAAAECTVSGHGSPDFVGRLAPSQLAALIRRTSSCKDKPVRLLACSTGEVPKDTDRINGGRPYGENLSRSLNRAVFAPEIWGWYMNDGTYQVFPTNNNLDYTVGPAAAMKDGADLSRPGQFIEFGAH